MHPIQGCIILPMQFVTAFLLYGVTPTYLYTETIMAQILQFKLPVKQPTRPASREGLELVLKMAKKNNMSQTVIKLIEQQLSEVGPDGIGLMPTDTESEVFRLNFACK